MIHRARPFFVSCIIHFPGRDLCNVMYASFVLYDAVPMKRYKTRNGWFTDNFEFTMSRLLMRHYVTYEPRQKHRPFSLHNGAPPRRIQGNHPQNSRAAITIGRSRVALPPIPSFTAYLRFLINPRNKNHPIWNNASRCGAIKVHKRCTSDAAIKYAPRILRLRGNTFIICLKLTSRVNALLLSAFYRINII